MKPVLLGIKYNKIAQWWHERHFESNYGVKQFEKALGFCSKKKNALDVGCGAGGRFIRILEDEGVNVTGIDVSSKMISIAKQNHPENNFIVEDICTWKSEEKFDYIYAWDSIFHLPLEMHKPVINKLCDMLQNDGILMYTFGNAIGENTSEWLDDTFYYSSIGINENLQLMINKGLTILHVELDQYPQRHVLVIAKR